MSSPIINDVGGTMNCYFCTVAALRGVTVSSLVKLTETMQLSEGASCEEVGELFRAAQVGNGTYREFTTKHALLAFVKSEEPDNASKRWGFGYFSGRGQRHMVILQRGLATGILLLDFQQVPLGITDEIPASRRYWLFHVNDMMDELTVQMARLSLRDSGE